MNNNIPRAISKRRSDISRKVLLQYCLSLSGYIIAVCLFVLLAWQFCTMITWQAENPIYWFLQLIKRHIALFIGIPVFIGWLVITSYFISRPLRYLDEVVMATEKLVSCTNEPIILSDAMASTENELNRVREKALAASRAAKEAEQRKNDLIIYLAHDLKTPLTSVIGYLTLLRDEKQISEELRSKYLSISLEKAEHLEDLINEFFEITRFNLSNISLSYSTINLTRMLEQLTYEFQPMLLEKNLTCELKISPDLTLKCDPIKMQRVFDNLLRNAVNYSFENSCIRIICLQENDSLCISFINHGNTIPQDKLDRIFEQFYRLDSARSSRSGGAGLGLAIAKEIVQRHHGSIRAKSADDIIEFEVVLPKS